MLLSRGTHPTGIVSIRLPGSKSISNRALIMRYLSADGISIKGLSDASDTVMLEKALQASSQEIFLGEGGTTARFFLAVAAITPGRRVLRGTDRLEERPMATLINALREMGAEISCLKKEGFFPVEVTGKKLQGGRIEVDASDSSQFISALMMIAPVLPEGLEMYLLGEPVSDPYIEMTRSMMEKAGAVIQRSGNTISILPKKYEATQIQVEADWSAASYFYSAVALNNELKLLLQGLNSDSVQGDSVIAKIFADLGVETKYTKEGVIISGIGNSNPKSELDFKDCPDLAQTLAATYVGLGLRLKLTGLQTLRNKETDRIEALAEVLTNAGVSCEKGPSELIVRPHSEIKNNQVVKTFNDHRMAMSFAPLAFISDMEVENPQVVSKSFPGFFDEMKKVGINARLI